MRRQKWEQWKIEDKETLKGYFERSIKIFGKVRIYTVLNNASASRQTSWVSAFLPLLDAQGRPVMVCVAREWRVSGIGLNKGFQLAYGLFHAVYEYGQEGRRYQDFLETSFL